MVDLFDPLGLVASCDAKIDYARVNDETVTVTTTQVIAQWTGAMCTPIRAATLQQTSDAIDLLLTEQSPPFPPGAPSCAGGPQPIVLTLLFKSPIATTVHASINGRDLPVHYPPTPASGEPAT